MRDMRDTTKLDRCGIAVWGRILLALWALSLSSILAFAASPKLARELKGRNAGDQLDVIVQYRSAPSQSHFDQVRSKGGLLRRDLRDLKAAAFRVSGETLADLANDPNVLYISPDRPIQATIYSNNPDFYESAVF